MACAQKEKTEGETWNPKYNYLHSADTAFEEGFREREISRLLHSHRVSAPKPRIKGLVPRERVA